MGGVEGSFGAARSPDLSNHVDEERTNHPLFSRDLLKESPFVVSDLENPPNFFIYYQGCWS